MNNESLKNEYRCLHSGDKTKWNQLTSLGEFIWDDVYIISLVAEDKSLGLPFEFEEDEVISIVVKDQSRDANNQNDRVIVQTLTRVERSTGNVLTYTRTRRYCNGEHKWGEWTINKSDGVVAGSSIVVDNNINTESTNPVQNKTIAQALEDAVARGRELAKRDLYIAAGALYNDTDEVIKRIAFWGEEVDHLPKHYYLNGLGDIGEEEMMKIYQHKEAITQLIVAGTTCGGRMFQDKSLPRTLFGTLNTGRWTTNQTIAGNVPFSSNNNLEIVKWTNTSGLTPVYSASEIIKCDSNSFFLCSKLRVIDRCQTTKVTDWGRVPNIEELRLYSLQYNVTLSSNPKISKASILYMIENVLKTIKTAVVITLNATTYAKCVDGGEWYEEVQTALNIANGAITDGGSINMANA